MNISLSRTLSAKSSLLLISFIVGYSFWSIIRHSQKGQLSVRVPLYIYNIPDNIKADAPEKIILKLTGSRATLATIDQSSLAAFINGHTLNVGQNYIKLQRQHLLLPITIEILEATPSTVILNISLKENKETKSTHE